MPSARINIVGLEQSTEISRLASFTPTSYTTALYLAEAVSSPLVQRFIDGYQRRWKPGNLGALDELANKIVCIRREENKVISPGSTTKFAFYPEGAISILIPLRNFMCQLKRTFPEI
jgi:hypothetical protein